MAGEITKGLLNALFEALGDEPREDNTSKHLLRRLNFYQLEWMVVFHTDKITKDITLTPGVANYSLVDDAPLYIPQTVVGLKPVSAQLLRTDIKVTTEDDVITGIELDCTDYIATGDKIIVEFFIKPYSDMSKTVDPAMRKDYHALLLEAVKSEYRDPQHPVRKRFPKIEDIEPKVKRLAARLSRTNRVSPGNFSGRARF